MPAAIDSLPERLRVYLVKPSKYDADGNVLSFWKGILPSNTLTVLKALVEALNKVNVQTEDIIEIIKRLDRSGRLYGQLIIE